MEFARQLASQFREVYLDGKWVVNTNLRAELMGISHKQAMTKIGSLNSIAALAYHLNYYVVGVKEYLQKNELTIRDQFSFDLPPIATEDEWMEFLDQMWKEAEEFARHVESMSQSDLEQTFVKETYGNYLRNVHVIIEHTYYHLGQIVLIKKLLQENFQ
ncbi:MAG: DUF1572 family protein [Saprospiraceae bacterium]|nr:DUF1572 family protein [Saprospiraceae bacterium]